MAFFTLARPFETHPPQVKRSVVLFRDKLGNLIVCEPEPVSTATRTSTKIPSTCEEIKTINTTINTTALQKYTIFEGTDGNKYLSPSASWAQEHVAQHCIQVIAAPAPAESVFEDEDEELDTPPYKLDHMYARKPVKPGEESRRPARRRSSKNSIKSEIIIQESADDSIEVHTLNGDGHTAPVPIISPSIRPGISRPRILNVREAPNSAKVELALTNTVCDNNQQIKVRQRKASTTIRESDPSAANGYQELQVGSFITVVSDGGNAQAPVYYQNGRTSNMDSIDDMNSSSRSTSASFIEESPSDSAVCFHISNEEVVSFSEETV